MNRLVLALCGLLLFCSSSHAQLGGGFMFPGPGTAHSTGGGSYIGPGDVVDYSTGAYYGLRAYSSATRGQKLVNVCDITGGTINGTCVDLLSDATTGVLVPQTGIGTNGVSCPGANCGIKLFYDLTAAGNCTGSCDMAPKTTAATMSTLTTGCAGQSTNTYCSTGVGSPYNAVVGKNFTIGAGALFVSASGKAANTASNEALMGIGSGFFSIGVFGTGSFFTANSQTNHQQIATQSGVYHAFAGNADGTTASYLTSDAPTTPATGVALPVTNTSGLLDVGGTNFAATAGQIFLEGGVSKGAPASATATSLNGNSKLFWGF